MYAKAMVVLTAGVQDHYLLSPNVNVVCTFMRGWRVDWQWLEGEMSET